MNVPEIRFKGFEGEWKTPKIKEIFDLRNGYTPSKSVKEYWENGTIPWFRMEDIRAKGNVLSEAFQNISPLAVRGEGLFKENSIILATTATIGVHAKLIAGSLANQRFTNFTIRKSLSLSYISDFVNYAFYKIDEWCIENTNSGGLLSVDIKSLLKQPFYTPVVKEQKKIASFFLSLESNIKDSEKKLSSLQQTKAACLQSMFPKEGETVPKVRFKGFAGEWVKIKAKEIFKTFDERNKPYLPVLSACQDLRGMTPRKDSGYDISHDKSNEVTYKHVLPGQFVIHLRSFQGGFAHASVEGITSPAYTVFEFIDASKHCDYYWKYVFMSKEFIDSLKLITYGIRDGRSISFKEFAEMEFYCPSVEEQNKISEYLRTFDKKIELETQRLEKLKQIKSACLDKMFV